MTLSLLCEISGGCKKILQSNLDYPDIDYPDFFSGPVLFMNINDLRC